MTSRDEEFTRFVAGSASALLRTAYLLTGERTAAEDLLQETLERVYVAWPRVTDPYPYTRMALVRASSNRWRARTRRPEIPLADQHERPQPDGAEQRAEQARVVAALAELPARQRATIVLRYLEDLSEAGTALVLGCSTGTVKSQSARALTRLRAVLGPQEITTRAKEGGR